MQLKKEILLFYILVLASAGIIIAADGSTPEQRKVLPTIKCSKAPRQQPSASPFNSITEGIWRYKA